MHFFFFLLFMATVPALTLAMSPQSPPNKRSHAAVLAAFSRLSIGSQGQPPLNRQISPPIAIPSSRNPAHNLSGSYSTPSAASSLSSSPASLNVTPGTSLDSVGSRGYAGCLSMTQGNYYPSSNPCGDRHHYYQDFPGQGYCSK